MLSITNLSVAINDTKIIHDLTLTLQSGSLQVLMGPNGSGKSSLAQVIMGNSAYTILDGSMMAHEQDVTQWPPHKRAAIGMFLAFQHPYELPGVRVFTFLKTMYELRMKRAINVQEFNTVVQEALSLVGLDPSFAERNVNEGFSGGEKKRFELLQLYLFNPSIAILDELDSGMDSDAIKKMLQILTLLRARNPDMITLVITHNQRMVELLMPDTVVEMREGTIITADVRGAHHRESKGDVSYERQS